MGSCSIDPMVRGNLTKVSGIALVVGAWGKASMVYPYSQYRSVVNSEAKFSSNTVVSSEVVFRKNIVVSTEVVVSFNT